MSRAVRSFWILTATTVLAFGMVSESLSARAGVLSDAALALSMLLLAASVTLLVRVTRFLAAGSGARTAPSPAEVRSRRGSTPASTD